MSGLGARDDGFVFDGMNRMLAFRGLEVHPEPSFRILKGQCILFGVYPTSPADAAASSGGSGRRLAGEVKDDTGNVPVLPGDPVALFIQYVGGPTNTTKAQASLFKDLAAEMDHLILFTKGASAHADLVLDKMRARVECFTYEDIAVDKLSSRLVPRYQVLTEGDVRRLEETHRLPREKFPVMLRDDPIAKYLGFRPGDVLSALDYGTFRRIV